MRVVLVPQLHDNYGYLLTDGGSGRAAIIDPADAHQVEMAAEREGLQLSAILATHHHGDHVGGVEDLLESQPGLRVIGYGPDAARIPGITEEVQAGDTIRLDGLQGTVLSVPCHTRGHVAYRFGDCLFTGDTLFAGGCGRFFEGTAAQMHRALFETFGTLADETRVYCGHEYTESNLRFAAAVEPENAVLKAKVAEVRDLRAAGQPTVPTTLGEERRYNPFLRPHAEGIKRNVKAARPDVDTNDPVAVLGALRAMKDNFQ